jgi:cell wall-associated NlpC family hydrolase
MRFGRPLLLALVLLVLAFPASALADEARLSEVAEDTLTPELEHADVSQAGEQAEETSKAKPVGRPRVVAIALRYLGTPYRWAGSSPSGFDCSGFVMYVYGRLGIGLPHSSSMLWGVGRPVARKDLQAGDIVFFNGLSHVGIYIGNGSFVHSPHSGDVVKISHFSDGWYGSTYDGARRIGQ